MVRSPRVWSCSASSEAPAYSGLSGDGDVRRGCQWLPRLAADQGAAIIDRQATASDAYSARGIAWYCNTPRLGRRAIASGGDSSDNSRSARSEPRPAHRWRRASTRPLRAPPRPNIPRNFSPLSPSLTIAWQLPATSKEQITAVSLP
jgi:hypothetical protein